MPVATRTTKAGQASRAKARASTLGASPPGRRAGPTRPIITIWPPTQTAAARTCSVSRTVSRAGASTAWVSSLSLGLSLGLSRDFLVAQCVDRASAAGPALSARLALLALPLGGALFGEGDRPLHGVGRREHDTHRLPVYRPPLGLGDISGALHHALRVAHGQRRVG